MTQPTESTINLNETDPNEVRIYSVSARVSRNHNNFNGIERFLYYCSGAIPFIETKRTTTYGMLFMFSPRWDYTEKDANNMIKELRYFLPDVKVRGEDTEFYEALQEFIRTDRAYSECLEDCGFLEFRMDYHFMCKELALWQQILDTSFHSHLFHPDLLTTLRNLAGYLSFTQDQQITKEDMSSFYKDLGWTGIFYTDEELEKKMSSVVKYVEKHYDSTKRGPLTKNTFSWQIQKINQEDLFSNNQQILRSEFQYLLYRITSGILKNNKDYVIWNRDYIKSFADSYKSFTGRSINNHKIAHIIKILQKYGYIEIKRRRNKSNLYLLGHNNPCLAANN